MAITQALGRLGATFLAMVQTRLELAAVELEEESQRFLGYLVLVLLTVFLFGIAIVLLALLIVILFWDSYRIEAVGALAALFGLAAGALALQLRNSFKSRPRLLAATVAELGKDLNMVKNARSAAAGHTDEH